MAISLEIRCVWCKQALNILCMSIWKSWTEEEEDGGEGEEKRKQTNLLSFKAEAVSSLMRFFRDILVKAALRQRGTDFSRVPASTLFLSQGFSFCISFIFLFSPFPQRQNNICVSTFYRTTKQLRLGVMFNEQPADPHQTCRTTSWSDPSLLLTLLSTTRRQTELPLCGKEMITDLQTGRGNKTCND